jgi:hypothetical protein
MTNNKALIRLRPKPKKPIRKKKRGSFIELTTGDSIEDILDRLPDQVAYADIKLDIEYRYDYDGSYGAASFCWVADEPLKEYEKRLEEYKKKIKAWNTWYNANEDLIVLEEKRRVKLKKGRDLKTLEELEAKVQREVLALKRQREKLGVTK